MKSAKPYIQFQCRKEWPNPAKKGKCFHIIGVDIIFDKDLNPFLLEINSNPSLNVDFSTEDALEKKNKGGIVYKSEKDRLTENNEISLIDLYVKKKVLGDAVRLFKAHRISEFAESEFQKFRSYQKVFDPEIESEGFGNVNELDRILEMFIGLSGIKFTASLNGNKFSKIVKSFNGLGNEKIGLIDADIAFKKAEKAHGSMDFEGFIDALKHLITKAWGFDAEEQDFLDYIGDVYDAFQGV